MKGIILAGGSGTRLSPITKAVSKQLIPVYDKPMIYYPLSNLLQAGIREIQIISTPEHIDLYESLLRDGSQIGISIQYAVQKEPKGIAEALTISESFANKDSVCLILGDNIFYHPEMSEILKDAQKKLDGAVVFAYKVDNPSDFGIIEIDDNGIIQSIEEKPQTSKSDLAIPGLYFFDSNAATIAKKVVPSSRGEKEITSVLQSYLQSGRLAAIKLNETKWFDTGTPDGLIKASVFIRREQRRTGRTISCIEELALHNGWISSMDLLNISEKHLKSQYGKYVVSLTAS